MICMLKVTPQAIIDFVCTNSVLKTYHSYFQTNRVLLGQVKNLEDSKVGHILICILRRSHE